MSIVGQGTYWKMTHAESNIKKKNNIHMLTQPLDIALKIRRDVTQFTPAFSYFFVRKCGISDVTSLTN